MDLFYKDANGVIFDYDKVSRSRIYTEPFYMEEQKDRTAPDGRLLLLKNQEHWLNVQKTTEIFETEWSSCKYLKLYTLCIHKIYINMFKYKYV